MRGGAGAREGGRGEGGGEVPSMASLDASGSLPAAVWSRVAMNGFCTVRGEKDLGVLRFRA